MATAHERIQSSKTLVCLLQGLVGVVTTLELRNEIVVEGTIAHVDHCMNTTVTGATYTKLNGQSTQFDRAFIHGNQIRYVHIPDQIDVMETINKQVRELVQPDSGRETSYQRQRVSRSKLERMREDRQVARELRLGRGRQRTDQPAQQQ